VIILSIIVYNIYSDSEYNGTYNKRRYTMAENYIKPGWKTTEFWTMIVSAFFGILILFGIITNFESNTMLAYVNNISGSLLTISGVISYIWSRGKAKENKNVDYVKLLEDIEKLVNTSFEKALKKQ
jgi:hypothetical protein